MSRAFLLFFLYVLCIPAVAAFGMSPAEIELGQLTAGGYAEMPLLVSSVVADEWVVSFESEGRFASWMVLPEPMSIAFGAPRKIPIAVEAPADAEPGSYEGVLIVRFTPPGNAGSMKYSRVQHLFSLPVRFVVTGDRSATCVIGGVTLSPAEQGQEVLVSYRVRNTGTVRVAPDMMLQFRDGSGVRLAESWSSEEILPTQDAMFTHSFRIGLLPDLYEATLSSTSCAFEESMEYVVASAGSLSRLGTLEELVVGIVQQGDGVLLLPVSASFKNTGDSVVAARLSGVVLRASDESVVAVIEGAPIQVLPGQRVVLEELVQVAGVSSDEELIVRAKVVYEGTLSEEHEVLVGSVVDDGSGPVKKVGGVIFLLILLATIGLIVLIGEKRRKR